MLILGGVKVRLENALGDQIAAELLVFFGKANHNWKYCLRCHVREQIVVVFHEGVKQLLVLGNFGVDWLVSQSEQALEHLHRARLLKIKDLVYDFRRLLWFVSLQNDPVD